MDNVASDYFRKRSEFIFALRNGCAEAYVKSSQYYRPITYNSRSESRNDEINQTLAQVTLLHDGIIYKILKRSWYEAFIIIDEIFSVVLVVKRESAINMRRHDYEKYRQNWLALLLKELANPEHKYRQLSWVEDIDDDETLPKLLSSKYKDFSLLFLLHDGATELNGMQIMYTDECFEVLERCDINGVLISQDTPEETVKLRLKGQKDVVKDRKKA